MRSFPEIVAPRTIISHWGFAANHVVKTSIISFGSPQFSLSKRITAVNDSLNIQSVPGCTEITAQTHVETRVRSVESCFMLTQAQRNPSPALNLCHSVCSSVTQSPDSVWQPKRADPHVGPSIQHRGQSPRHQQGRKWISRQKTCLIELKTLSNVSSWRLSHCLEPF